MQVADHDNAVQGNRVVDRGLLDDALAKGLVPSAAMRSSRWSALFGEHFVGSTTFAAMAGKSFSGSRR